MHTCILSSAKWLEIVFLNLINKSYIFLYFIKQIFSQQASERTISCSDIDGPTLENSRGYKVNVDDLGEGRVRQEVWLYCKWIFFIILFFYLQPLLIIPCVRRANSSHSIKTYKTGRKNIQLKNIPKENKKVPGWTLNGRVEYINLSAFIFLLHILKWVVLEI